MATGGVGEDGTIQRKLMSATRRASLQNEPEQWLPSLETHNTLQYTGNIASQDLLHFLRLITLPGFLLFLPFLYIDF